MIFDILKYLLQALTIAFVARFVGKQSDLKDILLLTITITVTLIILNKLSDIFFTHQVDGFSTIINLRGGGCNSCGKKIVETMDDPVAIDYYRNNRFPTGSIKPSDEKHAIYDTLIATNNVQTGGFGGLQQALGTQRTLRGTSHSGGGSMIDNMESLSQQTEPTKGSVQVNVLNRFIDDKMAMDLRNGHEAFQDSETVAERGLVYGTVPERSAEASSEATLYSGDLISISSVTGDKLILTEGNYIKAVKSNNVSPLNDKLFKLRIQKIKPSFSRVPIMYSDSVNIAYNNDKAQTVLINHDGDLNILKNVRDTVFEIQNLNNTAGAVQKETSVLICAITESGKKFLKINADNGHISLSAPNEATKFIITSQQGCGPSWRYIK